MALTLAWSCRKPDRAREMIAAADAKIPIAEFIGAGSSMNAGWGGHSSSATADGAGGNDRHPRGTGSHWHGIRDANASDVSDDCVCGRTCSCHLLTNVALRSVCASPRNRNRLAGTHIAGKVAVEADDRSFSLGIGDIAAET